MPSYRIYTKALMQKRLDTAVGEDSNWLITIKEVDHSIFASFYTHAY